MSILTVKNLNHGFGDRAIFEDVSFRLLKGEHVGLIGANGEGKSTFMNIITRKLQPDGIQGFVSVIWISMPSYSRVRAYARSCAKHSLIYMKWKQTS